MWPGVLVIPQLVEATNYQPWEEGRQSQFSGDIQQWLGVVLAATMGERIWGEGSRASRPMLLLHIP